jgi:hypothetical protein
VIALGTRRRGCRRRICSSGRAVTLIVARSKAASASLSSVGVTSGPLEAPPSKPTDHGSLEVGRVRAPRSNRQIRSASSRLIPGRRCASPRRSDPPRLARRLGLKLAPCGPGPTARRRRCRPSRPTARRGRGPARWRHGRPLRRRSPAAGGCSRRGAMRGRRRRLRSRSGCWSISGGPRARGRSGAAAPGAPRPRAGRADPRGDPRLPRSG